MTEQAPASDPVVALAGRVVVGVDGSDSSVDALRWAGRMATVLDRQIDAVTSWGYPAGYGYGAMTSAYRPDEDAAHMLETALKTVFGDVRPSGLRAVVVEGYAAQVLIEASAQAEMLVVGSRGHGGFVGMLIGSVSTQCVTHALCPVVVVRGEMPVK